MGVNKLLGIDYVVCPRCKGTQWVIAITQIGDGWSPTRSEEFACPVCGGIGTVDETIAEAYKAEVEERTMH